MIRLLVILALVSPSTLANQLQEDRWAKAKLRPEKLGEVTRIVERIHANRSRYAEVAKKTGVPAHVIASLHNMEASGSFQKHLHEGSPLTTRTRWVPKGRPTWGKPPFRWEDSAADALYYDRMERVQWGDLGKALYACEAYNGTGYLRYHPDVPTPYLWSGTTLYVRGKYTVDGKWDRMAVSQQIGVAAIWKRMIQRGELKPP